MRKFMSKFALLAASLALCVMTYRAIHEKFSTEFLMYATATFMWWLAELEVYLLRSRPTVAWITGDDSYPYITATKPSECSQELVIK